MAQTSRYVIVVLLAAMLTCGVASGESIVVQLLNGKTRKILKGYRVYIILGNPRSQHILDLKTDRDGKVRFDSAGEDSFQVRPVGVVDCGAPNSTESNTSFKVAEVLEHGLVTHNNCGDFNPEPLRGQITILTRSASALDLFRN